MSISLKTWQAVTFAATQYLASAEVNASVIRDVTEWMEVQQKLMRHDMRKATWNKVLGYEGAWSVLDENGSEVCTDLSSVDVVFRARNVAAERGLDVEIVDMTKREKKLFHCTELIRRRCDELRKTHGDMATLSIVEIESLLDAAI